MSAVKTASIGRITENKQNGNCLFGQLPFFFIGKGFCEMKTETIAAIATGMTNSGISVIRISGKEAILVADRIFHAKGGRKLAEEKTHTIHYGTICDGDEVIDEVIVLLMRAPRSYTTEDTVEIDCHGGMYVTKKILETVIKYGASPAQPGEFTKRAFLNGRIDLSQAESVMDLIQAKNEFARKSSICQLSGILSREIKNIREAILHEIAFIESALDDPEHISLEDYPQKLHNIVDNLSIRLDKLLASSDNGKLLKEGISTVIVGKPNAGKSSLLNTILGEERAIVTDIAGTTRDVLEEQIQLDGILLNIIDTAGIRKTEDIVEKIGVDKAKQYVDKADLVIYVVDSSTALDENDEEIMELLREHKVIVLLNKSDLETLTTEREIRLRMGDNKQFCAVLSVSAKCRTGIEDFVKTIQKMFFQGEINMNEEITITNIRHKTALQEALSGLKLVEQSICDRMPEDFYSIDLMHAYESLGSILGESVEDDLVNEIFSKFCMGK